MDHTHACWGVDGFLKWVVAVKNKAVVVLLVFKQYLQQGASVYGYSRTLMHKFVYAYLVVCNIGDMHQLCDAHELLT